MRVKKSFKTLSGISLLFVASVLPLSAQSSKAASEVHFALLQLNDAAIRTDIKGIQQARERLRPFLDDATVGARAHYGIALSDFFEVNAGNRKDALERISDGIEEDQKAISLDPELSDAYATGALLYFAKQALQPKSGAEALKQALLLLDQGLKLPANPRVTMMDALLRYAYDPKGPPKPEGVRRMERALQDFDQGSRTESLPDWWQAYGYLWLGQIYRTKADPDYRKAINFYRKAVLLRPDFTLVRRSYLPTCEDVAPVPAVQTAGFNWKQLASDPKGDGHKPALPDGKALYVYKDLKSGIVWFKLELYNDVDSEAFGVNLAFDLDNDQKTGASWWGAKSNFTYDRLFTVWLTRTGPGSYSGTIGSTDPKGIAAKNVTRLGKNNIMFGLNPAEKAFLIGIKASDLPASGLVSVVGAVGSSTAWNDDILGNSPARLDLQP